MQIEQIAKDAHHELVTKIYAGHTEQFTPWLLEFAKLVAAKERELCAKLCEVAEDDEFYTGKQYAENIRQERGEA